jgi:tetratricopeptide (TPR) repeat protein
MIGLIVLSLVGGTVGTTVGMFRARSAQKQAEWNQTEADRQRDRAEAGLRQANQIVEDFFTRISEERLLNVPGLTPLRKELLEAALGYYQQFLRERGDDPTVKAELAATHYRVARISSAIQNPSQALASLGEACRLLDEVIAKDPQNPAARVQLAQAHSLRGTLQGRSDPPRAFESYAEARQILETLLEQAPAETSARRSLANILVEIGLLRERLAQSDEQLQVAKQSYEAALAIRQDLSSQNPGSLELQSELARALYSLAIVERKRGNTDRAVQLHHQALSIQEPLAKNHPNHRRIMEFRQVLADIHNSIGFLHHTRRQRDEAVHAYRQARDTFEQLARDYPAITYFQNGLARTYINMAMQFQLKGEMEDVVPALTKACEIRQRLLEQQPGDIPLNSAAGSAFNALGLAYLRLEQHSKAMAAFQRAIRFQTVAHERVPENVEYRQFLANHILSVALVNRETKNVAEALTAIDEARRICRNDPHQLYLMGREGTLLAIMIAGAQSGDTAEHRDRQTEVFNQAVRDFEQAISLGYKVTEELQRDPQLDSVRERAMFQDLLRRLTGGRSQCEGEEAEAQRGGGAIYPICR